MLISLYSPPNVIDYRLLMSSGTLSFYYIQQLPANLIALSLTCRSTATCCRNRSQTKPKFLPISLSDDMVLKKKLA